MAHATTPTTVRTWTGRACLAWARFLQRTVAGQQHQRLHVARRNAAMRAAHTRGVPKDEISARTGLGPETVRKALKGEATTE